MGVKPSFSGSIGNGHSGCLICGYRNPWSFGLRFRAGDQNQIFGRFQANPRFQGYDGILHGGVITSLLDSAMTHCLFHRGVMAVTGDLRVRFHKPVPCDALVEVRARVVVAAPPLYRLRAELVFGKTIMASAQASFMQLVGP